MQSENGILLLFYIFLSHGNKKKKKKKKGGGCCVLSTSTMPTLERLKAVGEGLIFQVQKDAKCCILLHFGYKICVVKTLNIV